MGKDAHLNSIEWTELIFEGKNQAYGAFYLRRTSWRRHLLALLIMAAATVLVMLIPFLVETVKKTREYLGGVDTQVELATIKEAPEIPKEVIKTEPEAPPPPPLKSSIKFTPPTITDDDKVREDEQMASQDQLNETKVTISIANIAGDDDNPNAVDIAELEQHKVVVADEQPFMAVEQMPQFPGGDKALRKYLAEQVRYPALAAENNIQGRVVIRFVVGKDGSVSRVEVLQGIDRVCDEEAVRVVKSMPKWIPGRHNGRAVPVVYTVPIVFKLQ
ncbi:MAG: energy transducer TonB [Prevotellaceae bacterium]|jgi:protein TonB|nr:energy transducer TonB [Prevotellaceae bacterium]